MGAGKKNGCFFVAVLGAEIWVFFHQKISLGAEKKNGCQKKKWVPKKKMGVGTFDASVKSIILLLCI